MSIRQTVVLHQTPNRKSAACDGEKANERKLKPSVISSPIMETDFTQLEDGSLLEMIEDPKDSARAVFVLYKGSQTRIVDHVRSARRVFKPLHRDAEIIRHVRLPKGIKPCTSPGLLLRRMNDEVFSGCLDLDDSNRFLLACFVLSTWLIDCERMPVAPYLALVGLPASGKSTVLRVLRLLCRRSLLTADISSAAFYRVCERLTPTLLIDETATAGNSRDLFHLLRTGTSREAVALRKDESFRTYGAKVFAWGELPNDPALNSRCVVVTMHETNRRDLRSPSDPDIVAAADDIQKQLLHYRLENFNKLNPPQIFDSELPLHSRYRDLYNALGLGLAEDAESGDWLLHCLQSQQLTSREPLLPNHAAVLGTLFRLIHLENEKGQPYQISELTAIVNADLKESGECLPPLTPRGVGASLSFLGIGARTRTNQGWWVHLSRDAQKRVHALVAKHGLDNGSYLPSLSTCKKCDLCDPRDDVRNYYYCDFISMRTSHEPLSSSCAVDYDMIEGLNPQLKLPFPRAK